MGNLKPGKSIIYERDDRGNVWGRYHCESERWLVGSGPESSSLTDYVEWRDLIETAEHNPSLAKMLEKTVNTYRLMKK
jgi:hypothetical protein